MWFFVAFLAERGHVLLPALFVIGLLAATVVVAVNRTYVRVDSTAIAWSNEPLRVWPRRRIHIADVEQLFIVEIRYQNGTSYVVRVKTRDGKNHHLADVDNLAQARWLEYAIERHLGIEDRPVEGALPRAQEGAS